MLLVPLTMAFGQVEMVKVLLELIQEKMEGNRDSKCSKHFKAISYKGE